MRLGQGEQRILRTERVPQRVEVLVVRFTRWPTAVTCQIMGHEMRVVESGREHSPLGSCTASDLDLIEHALPLGTCIAERGVETGQRVEMLSCALGARERNAD